MSLRFWSSPKPLPTDVHLDYLAWFENSIHGGVVILGIFRDAIAISPSPYVTRIAEKTLSIIKGIAIAGIGDTNLRLDFRKLGEATAAVTATVLQSYLESPNRHGWPGSQLRDILEDLIITLDTIELWISSGQARDSFVRRKCAKMIKQFQERLSQVLERFELASLLQSYTVLPFIKKMVEEYAHGLDIATEKGQSNIKARDSSKTLPELRLEKEDDALRLKVRIILRIIEEEERTRLTALRESTAATQIQTGLLNHYPREKEHKVPDRFERQDLRAKLGREVDHEQDAEEMLYDMLMARFSNVASLATKPLPPIQERPRILSLPPSYSSIHKGEKQAEYRETSRYGDPQVTDNNSAALTNHDSLTQSTLSRTLSLDKPLPPLQSADIFRPLTYHGYTPRSTRQAEHTYRHSNKGKEQKSIASLPPGAMPPIVSTPFPSYANGLTNNNGWPDPYPPMRNFTPTPPNSSLPLLGSKKCTLSWKPSLPDVAEEDKVINPNRPLTDLIPSDTDKGKEKDLNNFGSFDYSTRSEASSSTSSLPVPLSDLGGLKKPRGCPGLPPGAMPPRLTPWPPPPSTFMEKPRNHRIASPGPTINSTMSLPSSHNHHPEQKLLPVLQSNSGHDLSDSTHWPATKSELDNKDEYHLPPIAQSSPITLGFDVGQESSTDIPPPPPPKVRPQNVGPAYEYLRKSSPHMQRYVEDLADRIWGDKKLR